MILGLTFKENCPDIRNTKVVDLISKLKDFGAEVDIHDPWIDKDINVDLCGANLKEKIKSNFYDGIILAVAHDKFKEMGIKKVQQYAKVKSVIYDLKYIFPAEFVDIRL